MTKECGIDSFVLRKKNKEAPGFPGNQNNSNRRIPSTPFGGDPNIPFSTFYRLRIED